MISAQPVLVQPNQFQLGGYDTEIVYATTSITGVPQLTYKTMVRGNRGVIRRNQANRSLFSNAARVLELGESHGYQLSSLYYPTIILPEVVVTPDIE